MRATTTIASVDIWFPVICTGLSDLTLLDLNLPKVSDRNDLRKLHQDPNTRDIPVIVISADETVGQSIRLFAERARAFATKPLEV